MKDGKPPDSVPVKTQMQLTYPTVLRSLRLIQESVCPLYHDFLEGAAEQKQAQRNEHHDLGIIYILDITEGCEPINL